LEAPGKKKEPNPHKACKKVGELYHWQGYQVLDPSEVPIHRGDRPRKEEKGSGDKNGKGKQVRR
jgi:hypothetical protein